jgi:TonB family protein
MADWKADIEKYFSGKLSPAEMHALERKALDDPFLAEALEGGAMLPSGDFIKDVEELQRAINRKTGTPKSSVWLWPMRIAAGLILLAVSAYFVVHLADKNSKANKDSMALQQSKPALPSTQPFADSVEATETLSVEEEVQQAPAASKDEPKRPAEKEDAQEPEDVVQPEESVNDFLALNDDDAEQKKSTDEETQEKINSLPEEEFKKEEISRAKSRAAEGESRRESRDLAVTSPSGAIAPSQVIQANKQVTGKVTDIDDGLPLPGVNVLVEGTSIGTVTDLNGNYQIDIPENQNSLVFSFIGMESKEISVDETKADDNVNVQLSPDVSELSEVVVTGYGTGEEPASMDDIKWEITEPEGGKRVYRNYLEQNIRYPQVAIQNNIEGKVTVQFTVEPNGQLTDFRVIKSLGSGCDDELIRLIREGPKWRPTKRNDQPVKSKAKVKMRFELPGKKSKN